MTKFSPSGVADLLAVPELQQVEVRPGVALRHLRQDDAPALLTILQEDPSIRQRVGVAAAMNSPAGVADVVRHYSQELGLIRFALVEQGVCCGLVSVWADTGYFGEPAMPQTYGFGFFLAPHARGRGLISDSLLAVMEVVAAALPVQRFIAYCEDDNLPSQAVLHRVGLLPTERTYSEPNHGWTERLYQRRSVPPTGRARRAAHPSGRQSAST